MEKNELSRVAPLVASIVLSSLAFTACATVSPDEMEGELSQLRAEIRENEERVQSLESRIQEVEQSAQQRMNELEQNLSGVRDEFGGQIERIEEAVRFNAPVYFDFDESYVRDQDRGILDRFVDVVNEYYPDAVITVEGFTDPVGPGEYNLWLGQQRAEAVREYLVSAGLAEDRIRTVSYGDDAQRLIVPSEGGPDRGWQNRRAALVIDHSEAAQGQMQQQEQQVRVP